MNTSITLSGNLNQPQSIVAQFFKYVIPAISSLVIMALYQLVDALYIGHSGEPYALTTFNIVYPTVALYVALAMLISVGAASHISILMGRQDVKGANSLFNASVAILVVIAMLFTAVGLAFSEPLSRMLGASDATLPYVKGYFRTVVAFSSVHMFAFMLSTFARNDNAPRLSMYGMIVGGIINIILDYFFVIEFRWGTKGAAIASGIGQMFAVGIIISHFIRRRGLLRFALPRLDARQLLMVLKLVVVAGLPAFVLEVDVGIETLLYNFALLRNVGELGVAAYAIVGNIGFLILMVFMGIGQGIQPIISYSYGQKNLQAIAKTYFMAIGFSLGLCAVLYTGILIFGRSVVSLFDAQNVTLVEMATNGIKVFALAFFVSGVNISTISLFQSTGQSNVSNPISIPRTLVFVTLGSVFLPHFFGINGIWATLLFAELMTFVVAAYFMVRTGTLKRLLLALRSRRKAPVLEADTSIIS